MIKPTLFYFILLILLPSVILLGCYSPEPTEGKEIKYIEEDIIMPDKMPRDFNFSLKYGVGAKSEINTFEDTYTKDLVVDGTITTKLTLSKAEMNGIYNKMKEIELLSTVQHAKYVGEDGSSIGVQPMSDYYLTMQLNGEIYKAHWAANIYDDKDRDALAIFFYRYLHDDVISNRSEFKQLPDVNGGYQ